MSKEAEIPQPLLLNIVQASQVLCLGKTKIYELIATEELPVMHIGKAVRFPYTALQQWVDRQRQKAQEEIA